MPRPDHDPQAAILNLKVCDPACGSGHFLIAAAHRMARRLAAVRTGDEEPAPQATRTALRDVIGHCIYGVDINPMAVELCKVSLWMEALEPGKPLSFLDHRIQCGNSLLGATPALLEQGIPDDAFTPIEGDDKAIASALKRQNKEERRGQETFFADLIAEAGVEYATLSRGFTTLDRIDDSSMLGIREKETRYHQLADSADHRHSRLLADAWCAAFVWRKTRDAIAPVTENLFRRLASRPDDVSPKIRREIQRLADGYQFFHWHLAFPDVFRVPGGGEAPENEGTGWSGGFDAILSNPPWEKINLKDEEFFVLSHPDIAHASNKATRKKLIEALRVTHPDDYQRYKETQASHDRLSLFFRYSDLFPFTGVSRINLYSVFAELALRNLSPRGRLGLVIASGIATDDNNKKLFEHLVINNQLICVWDFENREGIFSEIDSRYKFCLFCAGGQEVKQKVADFAFYLTKIDQLNEPERHFTLSPDELFLINPNTRTCPTFKSHREADLVKLIYRKVRAWCLHESTDGWPGTPKTPFNMSNDSGLFVTKAELIRDGGKLDALGCGRLDDRVYLPLYESKLIHQFNHRFTTFAGLSEDEIRNGNAVEMDAESLSNPWRVVESRYWLDSLIQAERFPGHWFLVYRMITNATNERTSIAAIIPNRPCGHSLSLIDDLIPSSAVLLCTNMNSFIYDFVARQKIAGVNFNHFILKQLPVLPPYHYTSDDLAFILPRVLELTYTAWDLEPFARDCCYDGPPFRWDEARRTLIRCELDALYFHLYGIEREDVDYIMETFPIVKRKDEARYGEYRTRRVILELYDAMARAKRTGQPYQTRLDPPPAHPSVAHPPR